MRESEPIFDAENAFAHGIALFNSGAFFEAHEVLEDVWRESRGPDRFFYQGLIHLAVAFHHLERGNRRGGLRQLSKGVRKLAGYLPVYRGIDAGALYRGTADLLERIEACAPVNLKQAAGNGIKITLAACEPSSSARS